MLKKANLLGLLITVLLITGCAKKDEPASTPATTDSGKQVNQDVQVVEENLTNEPESVTVENKKVKLQTSMGDIVIEMQDQAAPKTVANFLQYVESGFYDGVVFHRVMRGFMVQTGGFNAQMQQKRANPPVKNEFNISNTRGTVAMAKLGGNPDSATCQFFINLVDNSTNLDDQNGGFTVFGKVVEGMDVVDKIAAVQIINLDLGGGNVMKNVPAEPIIITSAKVVSE